MRNEEIYYYRMLFFLKGISLAIVQFLPILCGVICFPLYDFFYQNDPLSVADIINVLSIFLNIVHPIRWLMNAVLQIVSAKTSAKRLSNLAKIDKYQPQLDSKDLLKGEIKIKDGTFKWEDNNYEKIFSPKNKNISETTIILHDINIKLNKGEIFALVGRVGSGKSSLLLSMMNEMIKIKGTVTKNGKIAYISQEAFLLNDTIKNNIIFGMPYDKNKFDEIVKICQLLSDLELFEGKEETEIGERGINLSGGQKQRISIARAIYSESDIYLIDDALSALDAEVANKIFNKVILGRLKGKSIVITTHSLQLLKNVDRVGLVVDGTLPLIGKYSEIKEKHEFQQYSQIQQEQGIHLKEVNTDNKVITNKKLIKLNFADKNELEEKLGNPQDFILLSPPTKISQFDVIVKRELDISNKNNENIESQTPKNDQQKVNLSSKSKEFKDKNQSLTEKGVLTTKEKRFTGNVSVGVYWYYIKSAGIFSFVFYLSLVIIQILGNIGASWWVTQWAKDTFSLEDYIYIAIYICISLLVIFLLIFNSFFLGVISANASLQIFKTIVWNILRRPMKFFDTTPMGVVLNRCTTDIKLIDSRFPYLYSAFLGAFITLIVVLIFTSIISPIVIVIIVVNLAIVSFSFRRFLMTTTELKRLIQISTSPMLSLGSEFIAGVTTLRSYQQGDNMIKNFEKKADLQISCDFHGQACSLWMRSKIEYSVRIIVIIMMILIVINQKVYR